MKVLITGATGFIGRNLIRELEPAHELRLLDQARPEEATMFAGATRLVAPFATDWPFVQADITDEAAMLAAMDGMDAVIHLAGEPRGLPEIGVATFRDNALGTFVAIDTARRAASVASSARRASTPSAPSTGASAAGRPAIRGCPWTRRSTPSPRIPTA